MQISALAQLSRILDVIAGKARPPGPGQEPMAMAEAPPHVAAAQAHPLASVQMLVTLAALDPQRERLRGKGSPAKKQRGTPDVTEVEQVARYEANKPFELPLEWIDQGEHDAVPPSGDSMKPGETHVCVPLSHLDIEV